MIKKIIKKLTSQRFVESVRYYLYPQYYDIVSASLTFKKDGLYTTHNSDTLRETKFKQAYELAKQTGSFKGTWGEVDPEYRTYIFCWAVYHCKDLPGDYVECGVNKGGMARAAMHYIDYTPTSEKSFFLLDTYCGTPANSLRPDETRRNKYDECYEDVVKNFKSFPNVKIIRGEVPETLKQVSSQRICFLSLDMNGIQPELSAILYFWNKLAPGGIVVLDDYNNIGHEPQKRGFDKFCDDRGLKVMSLPTGQGLIFKPTEQS